MPISFTKKIWKNKTDPTLTTGDPQLQASEVNRIEQGIKDSVDEINAHEADTTAAHAAAAISVLDSGNHFAAGDVEAVLAEIAGVVGGTVFGGGTITGATKIDISDPTKVPLQIDQPNQTGTPGANLAYALLIVGPPDLTQNTEHRWFMAHPEGGLCLSAAYEPTWGILHLFKWGPGQSKPMLRITDEIAAGPHDLFIVDQNGGLIITPIQNFVDPVKVYDSTVDGSGTHTKLLFEIARDGVISGVTHKIDACILEEPTASSGIVHRNVVNLFRFPYYWWQGNPGDHIDFDVSLGAGSWYLDCYLVGGNDQGVGTAKLNGVNFGTGTLSALDAGATPVDKVVTLGPVDVGSAGRKTLSFVNASGNFGVRHAMFRRA